MKKFISTALATLLAFSSMAVAVPAIADDMVVAPAPVAENYSVYDFSQAFNDKANWQTEGADVTFGSNTLSYGHKTDSIIAYTGKTFENEIIEFNTDLDFNAKGWAAVGIRCTVTNNVIWSDGGRGYLFIYKKDYIEVQRWGENGQKFMLVTKTMPAMKNGKNDIQVGAINTENGVNIIFNVNGTQVVNVFDTEQWAVKAPGYVTFYGLENSVIKYSKIDDAAKAAMPPAAIAPTILGTTNVGETLTASYQYAAFNDVAEGDSVIQWYMSDKAEGETDTSAEAQEIMNHPDYVGKYTTPGVYTKIEGATGNTLTVTKEMDQKYLMCTVTPKNANGVAGAEVRSAVTFIDSLPFKMANSICMVVDSEFAFVNGTGHQIDEDNMWVVPTIDAASGRTLIPLRFIAESLNATIQWNPDTAEIDFTVGENTIHMTLNQTAMTVNGEARTLEVAPQVIEERTMLPLRAVAEIVGKQVFWDPDTTVIVLSDTENIFDPAQDAAVLKKLQKKITNAEF